MWKNSQQLTWPWRINESLPRRLGEKGLSDTKNNMDINEFPGYFRKKNWRYFLRGRKDQHLERSWRPESQVLTCQVCETLSMCLQPPQPPAATPESFLTLLFCPIPEIWLLQNASLRFFVLSSAFLLCLANGKHWQEGRKRVSPWFLSPSCLA